MKKALLVLAAGLMLGALAAQAKLPAPPAKTEAQKKAVTDLVDGIKKTINQPAAPPAH